MKLIKYTAFTLIELLVVITIIGILATGVTTVYTSQIQKSRDVSRISTIESLKSGVEQAYQDLGMYPDKGASFSGVSAYTPRVPPDPKSGQTCYGGTSCDYSYTNDADNNGVTGQEYELSLGFENAGNATSKGGKDGGNDINRLEMGIDIGSNVTTLSGSQSVTSWSTNVSAVGANTCVAAGSTTPKACTSTDIMVIR